MTGRWSSLSRASQALLWCVACVLALEAPAEAEPTGPRVHVVRSGETLSKLAGRYGVSVEALQRVNRLDERSTIHPQQRLLIPSSPVRRRRAPAPAARGRPRERASHTAPAATRDVPWRAYMAAPPTPAEVVLEGQGRAWRGRVDTGEALSERVRNGFSYVLFSRRSGSEADISSRLIRLLVQVSDTFGGRALHVVSGYRETSSAHESRHKTGRACDFFVEGVPNDALAAYLKTFPNVGVGYYPNSTFVHLDVRARKTEWTDLSGPGEAPRYVVPGAEPPTRAPVRTR
jgi:LysM repeat protein